MIDTRESIIFVIGPTIGLQYITLVIVLSANSQIITVSQGIFLMISRRQCRAPRRRRERKILMFCLFIEFISSDF